MYKVAIWGCGDYYNRYFQLLNKIAEGRSPVIDILAFLDDEEYCRVRS